MQEYELPVHQVVVNLEKGMARVPTQLHPEEIYKGYDLVNIHQFDSNRLLQSQVPEMVILAILGHYEPEQVEAVLRLIIKKLKAICHSEREMLKYLNQLTLLSRIRKFEKITKKTGSGVNPLIHSFQSPILKGLQATIHIFDPLPKNDPRNANNI